MTAVEKLKQDLTNALDAGLSHPDIIDHLRQLVLDRAKEAPPRKVLINSSYGGFGPSRSFTKYLAKKGLSPDSLELDSEDDYGTYRDYMYSRRDDPEIIAAITEFGRETSERIPFVAEDIRIFKHYKLADASRLPGAWKKTQSPELVEKVSQLLQTCKSFQVDTKTDSDFEEYAIASPDRWMFHSATPYHAHPLWVAHTLLKEDRDKHLVAPDPITDDEIFELVGLSCASGEFSRFKIQTVPLGVKYVISEYDGAERVTY